MDEKKTEKLKSKSTVQAVIFANMWKAKDARNWLKKEGLKPLGKVHKTKKRGTKPGGSLKYTIKPAEDFKKIGFKKIQSKGISLLLGSK